LFGAGGEFDKFPGPLLPLPVAGVYHPEGTAAYADAAPVSGIHLGERDKADAEFSPYRRILAYITSAGSKVKPQVSGSKLIRCVSPSLPPYATGRVPDIVAEFGEYRQKGVGIRLVQKLQFLNNNRLKMAKCGTFCRTLFENQPGS
jgi:hypothetical protein